MQLLAWLAYLYETQLYSQKYAEAGEVGAGGLSSDITGALLKALFHELNKLYFERTLACEVLWGPKSMIRSGYMHLLPRILNT